ncbi:MAG: hypothetical protein CL608_04700 [Anaerolineaceae bacterium]|nr:hypothetical protein [Anaerolineaceae bacterium]
MSSNNNNSFWEKWIIPIIVAVIAGLILLYIQTRTGFFTGSGDENQPAETISSDSQANTSVAVATSQNEEEAQEAVDEANATPTMSPSPAPTQTKTPTPTVPPTPTPRPNAQPGMVLGEGEEWFQGDLGITISHYGQEGMRVNPGGYGFEGDCIQMLLQNYTDDTIFLDLPTTLTDFYIEDPDGNQYRFNWYRLGNEGRYVSSFGLESIDPPPATEIGLCHVDPIIDLERWEYFRIGIRHLSTVRNAVWQYNIRPSAPSLEEIPQPTSTPLANAQPGMVLAIYEEWYQDNLGITLVHYGRDGMRITGGYGFEGDCVQLLLRNYSDQKMFLDDLTTLSDIYIEDPDGNRHNFNWYREGNEGRYGGSFGLTSLEPLSATEIGLCLLDPVVELERWESFIFGINRLVHITDAKWRISLR